MRIAELAERVQSGRADDTPAALDTPGRLALYNNLKGHVPANRAAEPIAPFGELDANAALALRLDDNIKRHRPDDWRGEPTREQMVKQAMHAVLLDVDEVNRLFPIAFAQKEY